MPEDASADRWTETREQLTIRWGRLTDEDFLRIKARRDDLAGVLQQRYGLGRDRAEKYTRAFFGTGRRRDRTPGGSQSTNPT